MSRSVVDTHARHDTWHDEMIKNRDCDCANEEISCDEMHPPYHGAGNVLT